MTARLVLLAGLVACSFTPQGEAPSDQPSPDGPVQEDPDAETPAAIVPCATPDGSGLVLCFELEDGIEDNRLDDSAPAGRHATTSGLAAATRDVPVTSGAVRVMADSTVRVAEDPALNVADSYTLAMWIRPVSEPQLGQVYGLVDRELQYALLLGISGVTLAMQNRCVHTDVGLEFGDVVPTNEWSFLACTFDGTTLCASRWTSATEHERFCRVMAPPRAVGAEGLTIGHLSENGVAHSRFDGELDALQVYDRSMTAAQLCALIGQPANCLAASSLR